MKILSFNDVEVDIDNLIEDEMSEARSNSEYWSEDNEIQIRNHFKFEKKFINKEEIKKYLNSFDDHDDLCLDDLKIVFGVK